MKIIRLEKNYGVKYRKIAHVMENGMRVPVKPELLRWAYSIEDLTNRFKKLADWESGKICPTLKQLEAFAKATYVPIGHLFLNKPPEEKIPIPDFRTIGNREIPRPSPDLLDTIYLCQQRQNWYRNFVQSGGVLPKNKIMLNLLSCAQKVGIK